ncbi:alpha-mannosidase [Devosia aurantiaca]|uniref:Alpha-mannosidase n=1 Tax=Devosia aurantiaca TaxID=2714858 RepID=A0A6M1SU01_9HYPH|nr:alpha-mannosidase [Devosia aurantiaca]NGP18842.1 alpha-mannosidase [Devosia aurantiaca]
MRSYRDRQRPIKELQAHLAAWSEELLAWEIRRRYPIGGWQTRSPQGEWRPIEIGGAWDDRIGIHHFRSALLDNARGFDVELRLDFGGEALVRLLDKNGEPIEAFGANPRHPRFQPVPERAFTIYAEVAARSLFGIPQRDPRLHRAELISFYPQVRALQRRIAVLLDATNAVKSPELARALCEAAEIGLARLRLPTATSDVGPRLADTSWANTIWERSFEPTNEPAEIPHQALRSVDDAVATIDGELAVLRQAYPKQGNVLITGHAHIDYAWLWPQPETVRKIHRTFSNVNALLKGQKDFTFLQSSSLFYRHIEEDDPALLAQIQAWAKKGRWEPIGGMLIECDTNMPSAEAFLRQFLLGQQDFVRYFGQPSRTAWLPDTFGFTGAMPQIMRHAGIDALVTIKVTWNETNPLPDNLFIWSGNDGSEVLTHTYDAFDSDGYNMWMTPGALAEVWGKHTTKDLTDTVIATYGWGDGGGGPDPDQIENVPLINLLPQIPTVRHGNIQQHLDALRADLEGTNLPRWSGEMYLEYHRATLTSQGRIKQLNRRSEFALVAAEALESLAQLSGAAAIKTDLSEAWVLTLRNQFHDILPGSSVREVSEQTEAELAGVCRLAEGAAQANLLAIASAQQGAGGRSGLAVANISGSAKTHWQIQSVEPLPEALQPQAIDGGFVVTIDQPLPPLSVSFVEAAAPAGVRVSDRTLENALVRIALDDAGRIASLFDKRSGSEMLRGPGNRLLAYRNDLPRRFDAWDIEPGFELGEEEITALDRMEVTAEGPHLAEITVVRRFGASRIAQKLRLWSNSPRLDIVTDLDWHDRRTYLRADFDLDILANDAQFDQAIGITSRSTHDNTSWQKAQFEACGHRFVSLAETDRGVALLSSDKYGFSAKRNRLTLSLVRGPLYPDMLADEGHQHFTYSILPHDGRWWSEAVQSEADLVTDPLRFVPATADRAYSIQPLSWNGQQLRVHALKRAEDGSGHVLRFSEAAGRRGKFDLQLPDAGVCVNGLETVVDGIPNADIRPFELRSVRF